MLCSIRVFSGGKSMTTIESKIPGLFEALERERQRCKDLEIEIMALKAEIKRLKKEVFMESFSELKLGQKDRERYTRGVHAKVFQAVTQLMEADRQKSRENRELTLCYRRGEKKLGSLSGSKFVIAGRGFQARSAIGSMTNIKR
jgi:predicted RNase H-like nuclease (RuvC/YqgF family)